MGLFFGAIRGGGSLRGGGGGTTTTITSSPTNRYGGGGKMNLRQALFRRLSSKRLCPELPLEPRRIGNDIMIIAISSNRTNSNNGDGVNEESETKSNNNDEECDDLAWSRQQQIQKLVGVTRVVPGYTGGSFTKPNYQNQQDHLKGLFIEYNPVIITYTEILSNALVATAATEEGKGEEDFQSASLSSTTTCCHQEEVVVGPTSTTTTTTLFPHNQSQQRESIEYLHDICSSSSSSSSNSNTIGMSLSIDIREVTIFYQAEDIYCQTGRSSLIHL